MNYNLKLESWTYIDIRNKSTEPEFYDILYSSIWTHASFTLVNFFTFDEFKDLCGMKLLI